MTEIVFIVDEFNKQGEFQTVEDRLKSISGNWVDNLYTECKRSWMNVVGKRIRFQAYDTITSFDPNKRYFYFCPIRNFENDIQKYFSLLSTEQLKRFNENNVSLLFSQDLEMIPNFEWHHWIKSLEWLWTVRAYNNCQNVKILLSFASKLIPEQDNFIRNYFNNSIQFIYGATVLDYVRQRVLEMTDANEIHNEYLNTRKEKQFLCLNKEPRFSRIAMLHGLRAEDLMSEGYISNRKPLLYANTAVKSNSQYANLVKNDMVRPVEEMRADNIALIPGDNIAIGSVIPRPLMAKSYYDLVAETTTRYELNDIVDFSIFSEKLAKSLYYKRPFMVNSGPYTLGLLRELGFKTYGNIFDESYDSQTNIIDRQEIICQNIKRYRNNHQELEKRIHASREIMEHNHNHLLNYDIENHWVNSLNKI